MGQGLGRCREWPWLTPPLPAPRRRLGARPSWIRPNKSSSGDVLLGTPLPQAPRGPHLTPSVPVPGILSETESPEG